MKLHFIDLNGSIL